MKPGRPPRRPNRRRRKKGIARVDRYIERYEATIYAIGAVMKRRVDEMILRRAG